MEENTYIKEVQHSQTNINNEFDLICLCEKQQVFVDCKIELKEDDELVTFIFDTTNLFAYEKLDASKLSRIRFLLSVKEVEKIRKQFIVSLHPDNLYFDSNLNVKILERDVRKEDSTINFLNQYKCLIATVLGVHSYEDYAVGGMSLMDKDPYLLKIKTCETVEEIASLLFQEYQFQQEKIKNTLRIPIKHKKNYQRIIAFLLIVAIGLGSFQIKQYFDLRKQTIEFAAMSTYVDHNYVDTVDILQAIATKKLTKESLYILAISYIKSSGLNEEAKNNALSQIKLHGNEAYSKFWVMLGRKEFEDAYEIANKFADNRLLYYGYSVEYSSLDTNTKINSEEKIKRKKELEDKIDEYIKKVSESKDGEK